MSDVLKQVGQLFISGYPGDEPPGPFMNFIAEEQIGGVILFEENCPSQEAARAAIARLRSAYTDSVPFVAIDQEGGRVSRLRGAPVEFKAAAYYGREGGLEQYIEHYRRATVFMEALGINLNLAPVCDLFTDPANSCLQDRCFGETPDEVIPFVEASVRVARSAGLLSCLKHFPGLGSSIIDPHKAVAEVEYDEVIWEQRERRPFAAGVAAGADMIMTTHVRFQDEDSPIVTGSGEVLQNLIRKHLGFDGPVITDDLTMQGAAALGNIGERTVAAFNAGHDLLLFGRDYEAAARAYDYFQEAVRRGEVQRERLATALGRVSGVKFKLDSSVLP